MAPPSRWPSPVEQLRELGIEARQRGLSFEQFWTEAVRPGIEPVVQTNTPNPPAGAVLWPTDGNQRIEWREVIEEGKEMWLRAYERRAPTKREGALPMVLEMREALGDRPDSDRGALVAA